MRLGPLVYPSAQLLVRGSGFEIGRLFSQLGEFFFLNKMVTLSVGVVL